MQMLFGNDKCDFNSKKIATIMTDAAISYLLQFDQSTTNLDQHPLRLPNHEYQQ